MRRIGWIAAVLLPASLLSWYSWRRAQILSPQDLHSASRFSSQADDSKHPFFLSQYAYALASAGYSEAALAALDRGLEVDPKDKDLRFVASQVFSALGMSDVAGDLWEPSPSWLPAQAPALARLRFEHKLGDYATEIIAADFLRWQNRFASSAVRFGRLVQEHPDTAFAWEGLAVALQRLGAYVSAGRAMQRYLQLRGASLDEGTRGMLRAFSEEMTAAAKQAGGRRNAAAKAAARTGERSLSLSAFAQLRDPPVLAARYASSRDLSLQVPEEFTALTPEQRTAWLRVLFRDQREAWIGTHWPTGGAVWALEKDAIVRLALWSNGRPPE